MKKGLRIISILSISLFAISWVMAKFNVFPEYNLWDFRHLFILIYLASSLKYKGIEVKEKDIEIQDLKSKLEGK
jgi:hypothetical protein